LHKTLLPSLRLTSTNSIEPDKLALVAFKDCLAIRDKLTPIIAFQSSSIQISGIRKDNQTGLIALVVLLITELSNNLNTTEKVNAGQIARIANSLIMDFWYFKLEEFVFVFDSISKRKNYNRLDQTVIYDAFNEYEQKRQSVIEAVKIQEFKQSEEAKEKEIQELRDLYQRAKEGKREPLYIEKLNEFKKQNDNKEDAYQKFKAGYLAKKEIEKIDTEETEYNQELDKLTK
jgi:hypothetical protein